MWLVFFLQDFSSRCSSVIWISLCQSGLQCLCSVGTSCRKWLFWDRNPVYKCSHASRWICASTQFALQWSILHSLRHSAIQSCSATLLERPAIILCCHSVVQSCRVTWLVFYCQIFCVGSLTCGYSSAHATVACRSDWTFTRIGCMSKMSNFKTSWIAMSNFQLTSGDFGWLC